MLREFAVIVVLSSSISCFMLTTHARHSVQW